jgi:hypothetical protein
MQTKAMKRASAIERVKNARYENSRANRLGSKTEAEWQKANLAHYAYLTSDEFKYR